MKVEMVDQLLQMQLSNPTLPTTMHFGMGSERKGPRPTKKKIQIHYWKDKMMGQTWYETNLPDRENNENIL